MFRNELYPGHIGHEIIIIAPKRPTEQDINERIKDEIYRQNRIFEIFPNPEADFIDPRITRLNRFPFITPEL